MLGKVWLDWMAALNTIPHYLLVAGGVAVGILLVRLLEKVLLAHLRKVASRSAGTFDDLLVQLLDRALVPLGYYGVIALGLVYLELPPWALRTVKMIGLALVAFHGARIATAVIAHALARAPSGVVADPGRGRVAVPIVQVAVWGLALIFLLDNLGVQVSAVITGLGIGGIAVALAAQAILGDLFSYVAIVFDRPFSIGDYIVVDNFMGTVEHIGIKTTRVRSLSGELIVFGNSNLLGARLRNFRSLERRRVVLLFGVSYTTTSAALEAIPALVREIFSGVTGVTLDRVHFQGFSQTGLDFEVVYFVETPDYTLFMDRQQTINLGIKARFEKMGIDLAAAPRPATPPPPPVPLPGPVARPPSS